MGKKKAATANVSTALSHTTVDSLVEAFESSLEIDESFGLSQLEKVGRCAALLDQRRKALKERSAFFISSTEALEVESKALDGELQRVQQTKAKFLKLCDSLEERQDAMRATSDAGEKIANEKRQNMLTSLKDLQNRIDVSEKEKSSAIEAALLLEKEKVEVITTYKGHLEKFERRDKHSSKIRNDLIHQFDALRVDNEKALTDITATKERGIELIDEKETLSTKVLANKKVISKMTSLMEGLSANFQDYREQTESCQVEQQQLLKEKEQLIRKLAESEHFAKVEQSSLDDFLAEKATLITKIDKLKALESLLQQ